MDDDPITDRLRGMGEHPVPDELRDAHLHRLAATTASAGVPPSRKRFGRFAVAAAAVVGFFAGSTGLAVAGALPGPAQGLAHDVLSVVQVDVDDGRRGNGPPAFIEEDPCKGPPPWAGQPGHTPTPEERDAFETRRSECPEDTGRPDGAGRAGETGRPDHAGTRGAHPHEGDPCKGPPPWAGDPDHTPTAGEEADFEARRSGCADESRADDEGTGG